MLRGKERILIALRNGESVMLGHVQKSGQSLTVRCHVAWTDVDLVMVVVTKSSTYNHLGFSTAKNPRTIRQNRTA